MRMAGVNQVVALAQDSLDSTVRLRDTWSDSTGTPQMDVSTWLRDLGLEDYVQAFQANHIDAKVLPRLTADDLIALGITSVGHRRLLLDAIAAFDEGRGPAAAEPTTVAARPLEAERRQLTVLFCDLVDSTELASRLDPEDLRDVMRAYQAACANVVSRFEGHVARFLGDGVLAYFGWPRAHEDDAERAVRAGLQLVQDIARLEPRAEVRLQARVGVATGHVVVGDLISGGSSDKDAVSGDTPNLAARLQALAAPASVVISQATRRLLGGLFELADLGPVRLKGFAEALSAFRVEGKGQAEGRFDALHGEHLTPLVGREHELGILLERWYWARDGDGQVVLLAGEPGIGKSRLLRTLRERLGDDPYTPLSHYCSPHHTNSALYPVIDLLERAARLERNAPPEEQLDKIEAVLAGTREQLDEALPAVAALLGVPTGARYPALIMGPEVQKHRTLQALLDQLAALAARQPVLALYEDVHWSDPSTLELLGMVIERVRQLPVLVLITFRPEFQPPWTSHAHVTTLTMSRLGRRQGADLVARVTGDKPLPPAIVEQIVARTDGVPLFVEELTKAVLESGLLADAGDHWELAGPLPPLAIPTTLHDSLMARLDRLAPVKEVAQTAAVIGREFSHELLAAVSPLSEADLHIALDQLVQSELVFRRGIPPEATYTFKHALVQDAAYQSLLKSRRQQLHARIAQVLESRFPGVSEGDPEVLARHTTEAGLAAGAIPYWRRAGGLAAGRWANVEAIAHLSKGLELVETLPAAPEHLDEELALRLAIGGPLMSTKGYAAPELERSYSRAWSLCEQLDRSDALFPVLRGLWTCYFVRGELARAYDLAERLVVLADKEKAPLRRAHACRAVGCTSFYLGRLTDASEQFERGTALSDAVSELPEHRAHALLHGEHPGVFCRTYLAWVLWLRGLPDQAAEMVNAALDHAQRLGHPYSTVIAASFAAVLHTWRHEYALARLRAETTIEVATDHDLGPRLGFAIMARGAALVGLCQQPQGIAAIRAGLDNWNRTGARLSESQWLGLIAEAHLQAGQLDYAHAALDKAAEATAATGECYYQAELYRLRGVVSTETGEHTQAALWLQRAIEIARSQKARSWELRAATSLARLWRDQGKRAEAHDLLEPVYEWFTEGFDTADLKDAKALLDELA
jgi:class 3 adenylate cyclase/predicted ATPase